MVHACSMPTRVAVRLERSNAEETPSPLIRWSLCPAFVCRQREVKRAVLSRAANLWPYLPVKSIEVSESRAECAGGGAGGATPGLLPPGPLLGGTCLSLHPPSLLLRCSRPPTTKSNTLSHGRNNSKVCSDTSVP